MSTGPVEVELRLPGWARSPSVRRHGPAVAALCLLIAGLVLKSWLLSRSFFVEDDIVFIGRAADEPFDWDHLFRVHIGHLMPGAFALVRAVTAVSAYDWALVSAVIMAVYAGAALALHRLLRLLFGARPLILVPLALFLFAPANFQAGTWFAAALNILPMQVALLMAMCSQVLLIRTGRARHALAGIAWTCAGLLFFEKAVVIPPVLFLLTVLLLAREHGVAGAVRRHLGLWLAYAAVGGAYLAGYVLAAGRPGGTPLVAPEFYTATDYLGSFLGGTVPTLLVGGPLSWGTVTSAGLLVAHRPVEVAVAWLVLAAVVAGTCRRRPEAAGAWALAAGYLLVADGLLIMVSRAGSIQHALESRYIADATPVLAVCLALALMPWRDLSAPGGGTRRALLRKAVASRRDPSGGERRDPSEGERRDPSGRAGTVGSGNWPPPAVSPLVPVATCAYMVLALVSAAGFAQGLPGGNRAYFEAARADLAALGPETGVYPSFVPDRMLFPWQAVEDRLTSRALSPLAEGALREKVRHPEAARRAVTFDERGHLVPATVFGGYLTAKEGSCLPVRNGTVVAEFPAAGAGNVARVDYRVTRDTRATVLSGDRRSEVLLRADWDRIYFPVPAVSGPVRISVPGDGACLRLATVGAAVPEGAGNGGPREVVSDGAG
ncbi:hypothetical protein [Streptosporangium sp. NBC_01756]|uniref:hypothetical protein n=1 Tax=Streptosporangium sp. NBC_01756 TaxID=2975950 RepID=UPI002DD80A8C|nr:hypothetical protein [Streptosporangium sp. NBC_01756]WSC83880.1 hypothetical protein OIE48_26190 [Streptosporangium sp. NBC_01756]